ncbi:MAG: glycosyltransferase family 2 protein [Candidatus Hodarchaeota archaeon]
MESIKIVNKKKQINIIIPCYNESKNVISIVNEIDLYMKILEYDYEFIFVDDGSTDNTYGEIINLSKKRDDINIIKLSRNFGKESAICVGLSFCDSDAAIILDADLQHPPYFLPLLISEWEKGANIVDAVKIKRDGENIIRRIFSFVFHKIMNILTNMDFAGASDYKLLDSKAINIMNNLNEKNRFFRGLTNWIGLKHIKVEYQVDNRIAGKSKWSWTNLIKLSLDAIISYTSKPLYIVTFLGLFTFIFSVILGLQTIYDKICGNAVSGFATVILTILILSSIIMISIGILGLYLSKIYNEVKNRPIYIIEEYKKSCETIENKAYYTERLK